MAKINLQSNVPLAALDADINDSVTSLDVGTGEGATLPPYPFVIGINEEAMLVTLVATDTLTVTRGYVSTTAAAHTAADVITHAHTHENLLPRDDTSGDYLLEADLDVDGNTIVGFTKGHSVRQDGGTALAQQDVLNFEGTSVVNKVVGTAYYDLLDTYTVSFSLGLETDSSDRTTNVTFTDTGTPTYSTAGGPTEETTLHAAFDSSDYVDAPWATAYATGSITIWYKGTGGTGTSYSGGETLFAADTDASNKRFGLSLLAAGTVSFVIGASYNEVISTKAINDDVWHMVTVVMDSATDGELFIDGVSQGTNADTSGSGSPALTINHDRRYPTRTGTGGYAEFSHVSEELTAAQILALYDKRLDVPGATFTTHTITAATPDADDTVKWSEAGTSTTWVWDTNANDGLFNGTLGLGGKTAHGSTVTASQYDTHGGLEAENALDVDITIGTGRSHTTSGTGRWWAVEFNNGAVLDWTHFAVRAQDYSDGLQSYQFNYQGKDPDTGIWSTYTTSATDPGQGNWVDVAISGLPTVAGIRITADDSNYLILGSVEAWGTWYPNGKQGAWVSEPLALLDNVGTFEAQGDIALSGFDLVDSSAIDTNYFRYASTLAVGDLYAGTAPTNSSNGTNYGSPANLNAPSGAHKNTYGSYEQFQFTEAVNVAEFVVSGVHPTNYTKEVHLYYSQNGSDWTFQQYWPDTSYTATMTFTLTDKTVSAIYWRVYNSSAAGSGWEKTEYKWYQSSGSAESWARINATDVATDVESYLDVEGMVNAYPALDLQAPSTGDYLSYVAGLATVGSRYSGLTPTITTNGVSYGTVESVWYGVPNQFGLTYATLGTGDKYIQFAFPDANSFGKIEFTGVHGTHDAAVVEIWTSPTGASYTLLHSETVAAGGGTYTLTLTDYDPNVTHWRVSGTNGGGSYFEMGNITFYDLDSAPSVVATTPPAHTVSATAPSTPAVGDVWVNPNSSDNVGDYLENTWLKDLFIRPDAAHAYDDEFGDSSKDAAWVETTVTGTATWTETRGRIHSLFANQTAKDAAVFLKPLDSLSSPLTIETAITITAFDDDNTYAGLMFADGTASSSNCVHLFPYVTTDVNYSWAFWAGTLSTLIGTNHGQDSVHATSPLLFYQRFIWSATNSFKGQFSLDGYNWLDHTANTVSETITPTHFGVFTSTDGNAGERAATFEYFRVTESDLSL